MFEKNIGWLKIEVGDSVHGGEAHRAEAAARHQGRSK